MHTPAPWKNIGREIRHAEKSMILATVYNHLPANQQPAEAEANARLIAAAPELLEALKNAIARMEENKPAAAKPRDDMHKVYARAVFYRDLEAARAAIAKAEGK